MSPEHYQYGRPDGGIEKKYMSNSAVLCEVGASGKNSTNKIIM
jgi:hypothetical protein